MIAQQPDLDKGIFYSFCEGDKLVTDVPDEFKFLGYVDFSQPHQAYFCSAIATVFLSEYAQQKGSLEPLNIAEELFKLTINGTDKQFNDPDSVQICKYPWGLARFMQVRPQAIDKYLPELLRMAHWFADWQNDDGSWSPSAFLTAQPSVVNNMSKTAEHIMETSIILQALGYAKAYTV
jgi:hypothetical protein